MKATKRKVIPKKVRDYKEGFFVEPIRYDYGDSIAGDGLFNGDNSRNMLANGLGKTAVSGGNKFDINSSGSASAINSVAQLGASAVNSAQPVNGDTSAGLSAASGALSGAGTGAMIGSVVPGIGTVVGGAVGAVVGGTAGLISGGKKHQAYLKQQEQLTQDNYFNTRGNMQSQNIDPYGMQMAFGDTVPDTTKPKDTPKYSPRDYTIAYTNSLMYKNRLAQTGNGTKPQSLEDLYNTKITNEPTGSEAFYKNPGTHSFNKINYDNNQTMILNANKDEVMAHEWSHLARKLSTYEQNYILNLNNSELGKKGREAYLDPKYNPQGIKPVDFLGSQPGNQFHDVRPDENKADLDALRYQLYKAGIYDTSKGNLDIDTLNKALSNPEIKDSFTTKRLLSNFKPEDIVQMNNTIASVGSKQQDPNSIGNYANGASVGLSGRASGKFFVPNAGLRRFSPHMNRVGRPNPLPSNNLGLRNQQGTEVDTPIQMEMGGDTDTPTNTQQNMINIQKGELLIDPDKGKILQEYKGINPLTGGLYEPHSKNKAKESPNNFTMADPGLFVITKKTAKQYKDAVDNNDKISQKTVLMNIRNAKIAKEGGLQPLGANYADGDTIIPYGQYSSYLGVPNSLQTASAGVNPQLTNFGGNQINNTKVNNPELTNFSNGDSGNTLNKVGDLVSNYGPALYNIGQGIFGSAQRQAHTVANINPYTSQVIANMPKNVNMQPVINDIYNNQELANKNLEGQTNSSAVYRANRQALAAGTNRSLSDARMKSAEINNQAAGQRAYMYNALGYQNQQEQDKVRQYNLGIDEMNDKAQAAKQNLLNAGLSQLQQTTQNDKANKQKAGMDKYALELLSQTFPNSKFYNQFQIDYVNKLLGRQ